MNAVHHGTSEQHRRTQVSPHVGMTLRDMMHIVFANCYLELKLRLS